jgi:hypothetical protein
MIRRTLSTSQGMVWESGRSFSADGVLEVRTTRLLDPHDGELMEVETNENGEPRAVVKYYWNPSGDLRYAASYNDQGQFSSAQDFEEQDSVSLAEITRNIRIRSSSSTVSICPRILAGTRIPDPR